MSFRHGRPTKFGNVRTVVDGIPFDSKAEASRYIELMYRQRMGEITNLARQVPYEISLNGSKVGTYRADFTYFDQKQSRLVVEDVKGRDTPLSKFKRKCVEAQYRLTIDLYPERRRRAGKARPRIARGQPVRGGIRP